jgi:hypothetical protein
MAKRGYEWMTRRLFLLGYIRALRARLKLTHSLVTTARLMVSRNACFIRPLGLIVQLFETSLLSSLSPPVFSATMAFRLVHVSILCYCPHALSRSFCYCALLATQGPNSRYFPYRNLLLFVLVLLCLLAKLRVPNWILLLSTRNGALKQ